MSLFICTENCDKGHKNCMTNDPYWTDCFYDPNHKINLERVVQIGSKEDLNNIIGEVTSC